MSAINFSRLEGMMRLSIVPRWTIVPMNRHQSVAEHSFRVAVIALEIAEAEELEEVAAIVKLALIHDAAECFTSDLPTPVKGMIKNLSSIEQKSCPWVLEEAVAQPVYNHQIVGMADALEAYAFLRTWGTGPRARSIEKQILERIMNKRAVFPTDSMRNTIDNILATITTGLVG